MEEEHLKHIQLLFKSLRCWNQTEDVQVWILCKSNGIFGTCSIRSRNIPNVTKGATNITEAHHKIGLIRYYRKFFPVFSDMVWTIKKWTKKCVYHSYGWIPSKCTPSNCISKQHIPRISKELDCTDKRSLCDLHVFLCKMVFYLKDVHVKIRCHHSTLCWFVYSVNDKVNNSSQEIHAITPYIDFEHIKGKDHILAVLWIFRLHCTNQISTDMGSPTYI